MINTICSKFKTSEYNCAQSMIMYVYSKGDTSIIDETKLNEYMKIGKAFGGGMSGLKQTCGFLSGYSMALCLYLDPKDPLFKEAIHYVNEQLEEITKTTSCAVITKDYQDDSLRKDNCVSILNRLLIKIDRYTTNLLK